MCFFKKDKTVKKTTFDNFYEQHLPTPLYDYLITYGLKVKDDNPQVIKIIHGTLSIRQIAANKASAKESMPTSVSIEFEYKSGDKYLHGNYLFAEQNWFLTRLDNKVRGNKAAAIIDMDGYSAKECHNKTSKEVEVIILQLSQFRINETAATKPANKERSMGM